MNPESIPFNSLICGPTFSGKTRFVIDQLRTSFKQKFSYIILICPTYYNNKTWDNVGINDGDFIVLAPEIDQVEAYLGHISQVYSGENVLIILDDVACGSDVKKRVGELVRLAFGARHEHISIWLLTQQMTSVSKAYRENIGALVLFYTPSHKDLKNILEDYSGGLSKIEFNQYIRNLRENPHSKLIFNLRPPYDINIIY